MQNQILVDEVTLFLQADGVQPAPDGYFIQGDQIVLMHPYGATLFYRHGFHSWSFCSWIPLGKSLPRPSDGRSWPQIDHPAQLEDYPFVGSGVGALQAQDGKILLLGALDLDTRVRADRFTLSGQIQRPPAGPVGPPARWYLAYGDEEAVFESYTSHLSEIYGYGRQDKAPRVWCSWYSMYTRITQEKLLSALEDLRQAPFDVFQIDDGWQVCMGDWEANEKFAAGMAALAEKISQAGFTPGIWLAPFIVQPKSSLIRLHPDWLLRDERGEWVVAGHNWGDVFYSLDVTHPDVKSWLKDLILKVRSWGFSYLKLDFLYAAALPGLRYQQLPDEQAYRMGLSVLRQAAGEAYVLVCGSPILASLGLVDAMRIGPDVAPYWQDETRSNLLHDLTSPGTLNAIRTTIHRLWLRPLLHIDPDVVFIRERYNLLLPEQRQYLKDLAYITGFLATSDPLAWLDDHETRDLVQFLESHPKIIRLGRYLFQVNGRTVDFSFLEDKWRT